MQLSSNPPTPAPGPAQSTAKPARADTPATLDGPPPFETFLAQHEVEIYRYLRRLSPTAEDAADLHQETFLRAYRAYPGLPAAANARAWLYRIATNAARDAYRKRRTRSRFDGPRLGSPRWPDRDGREAGADTPEPRAGLGADPLAVAQSTELAVEAREALLTLTARQRIAVVARVFEDRDYAAVAELLDCSEATARQHVHHGLQRLRVILSHHLEVPA